MKKNFTKILTLFLVLNILFCLSIQAQSGDNCNDAVPISTCAGSFTNPGINPTSGSSVGTNGTNSYWYVFTAPVTGTIDINSCNGGTDTEVAIHDLGTTGNCSSATATPPAYNDDSCPTAVGGSSFASEINGFSVSAGNIYAIEWGDRWSVNGFDWSLSYVGAVCESITVTNVFANTVAAQIDIVDTLSDGSAINADIEFGLDGFVPGTGTVITGISNPVILTGLSPGTTYDYCITNNNCAVGLCPGITCGTFTTDVTCVVPDIVASTNLIAPGFFEIIIEVTNSLAFGGGLVTGNPSGFDVLVDSGTGFIDSGLDVVAVSTQLTIPGPFPYDTPITIELVGIDDTGCPASVILEENCDPLECEAIPGVTLVGTTANAAQIDFIDTLSDGTIITADIEYGPSGFAPGTGTIVSGNTNPIILTGLSPGLTYDYCLSYACPLTGCPSILTCGSFTTDITCVVPLYTLTATCIATGFFSIDVQVTNSSAFGGGLVPGNPSGFDIFIDSGTGFMDSGVDVTAAGVPAIVAGPFPSGTPVNVQIFGIDDVGCPAAIQSINQDCSCFGFAPSNDLCANAISLVVDTIASCDGITAPYTLECANVNSADPVGSCFNGGNNANVWFTFVAPPNGDVTISTDYAGGILTDTEIALYSGTCGGLTEIACDQDSGVAVSFNSIINATNLIAGDTYFILADRWATSPDESFCIDVIDNDPVVSTCPQVLNITGLVATGTYSADDVITSNGMVTSASGGPVNYEAGANAGGSEYIELTSGFVADGIVDFTAINIQCDLTD